MSDKLLKRIIGGVVFLISALVLFSTVQPSVSFWDCGEFLAAAHFLQVPHPPGAPFFLILGRIFQMIPFVANIALRMNTISVLTSAMTITFLYFIVIMLVQNYQGNKPQSRFSSIVTYTAAAIGALSFSFSDTFWFNGVEAELYALSICLAAYIVWLILRWNVNAEKGYAEQYILMIAYLIGIAAAVHLMSVLLVTPVVMVIIFRKYITDEELTKQSGYILLGHIALILVIAVAMWNSQTSATPPTPAEFEAYDSKFILIMVGISIIYMGVFYKKILNRSSIYLPIVIGGVSLFVVYPGIVKDLPALMNTIAGNDVWMGFIIFLVLLGILAYGVRYSIVNKRPTLHLISMSLILILVGFGSFAMVIIRANDHPPMDENEPDEFPELVSYLNRTQYGDFPIFDRRFADDGMHQETWQNYSSDLDFFWRYQMNHMETRYWLWNYVGRSSWDQDSGPDIAPFNGVGNLLGSLLGIHFEGNVANSLYGIPFLLGLLGIYFHFKDDWKMAAVLMVMFLLMGYLTAFYQNQQEPQPRERDYFYVGAFFVFSIWIGIAVQGLANLVRQKIKPEKYKNAAVVGVLALAIIFVPINMYKTNYFTHDRSHNWVPWDYSYNILQSCAPNAILFTNGDNDTFPLWYLQDVEGVRRDVKIVNLSLLNTNWYISELKNDDPYHVGKVNINLTDAQIDNIQPIRWTAQNVTIPGPNETEHKSIKDVYQEYHLTDSTTLKSGGITFKMNPTLNYGNVKAIRVQDIMVKQIVEDNHWQRPIYFSVTCSEDSKIGLDNYLRLEGMASRLVPQKGNGGFEFIQPAILKEQIEGNKSYSKTYKPGFKFRGLNNPNIFYDQNHQRMLQNYRNAFLALAFYDVNHNMNDSAIVALNMMQRKMPRSILPIDNGILFNIGNLYSTAGAKDTADSIYKDVENSALRDLKENPNDLQSYNNPYRILIELYSRSQEYGKLADIWEKIANYYPDDPTVKANIKRYRALAKVQAEKQDSMAAAKSKGK